MTPRTPTTPRRGFSLIEVLVVVSIIVILVGLALAGINFAYQRSEESNTRALLGSLAGVEKEYRAQTGQYVHPVPPATMAQQDSVNGELNRTVTAPLANFLDKVQDNSAVAGEMLRRIQPQLLTIDTTTNRITAIKDPWGTNIYYYRGDGNTNVTGRTLPKQPHPYFVSAGADADLGTVDANNNPIGKSADNLYSFEVK